MLSAQADRTDEMDTKRFIKVRATARSPTKERLSQSAVFPHDWQNGLAFRAFAALGIDRMDL